MAALVAVLAATMPALNARDLQRFLSGVLAKSLITCKPQTSTCHSVCFSVSTHCSLTAGVTVIQVASRPLCMGVFVLCTHGEVCVASQGAVSLGKPLGK